MIKRLLYLGYYLKKMDWKNFKLFLNHAAKLTNRNKISLVFDAITCVFKYNISLFYTPIRIALFTGWDKMETKARRFLYDGSNSFPLDDYTLMNTHCPDV